jgi:hypothetical protein
MPQSYVGKPVISKGIEEPYVSLWRLRLGPASWDRQRRACAVPGGPKGALHLVRGTLRSIFRQPALSGGRPSFGKVGRSAGWFRAAAEEADGSRLAE